MTSSPSDSLCDTDSQETLAFSHVHPRSRIAATAHPISVIKTLIHDSRFQRLWWQGRKGTGAAFVGQKLNHIIGETLGPRRP